MSTNLAKAIRELRGIRSQQQFADELEASRPTVSNWETGDAIPSLRHARALVAMGLPVEVYMGAITSEVA